MSEKLRSATLQMQTKRSARWEVTDKEDSVDGPPSEQGASRKGLLGNQDGISSIRHNGTVDVKKIREATNNPRDFEGALSRNL